MYKATKRIVTVLFLCLLLFLFTVPSIYLNRVADELLLQSASARRALEEGRDPAPHFEAMVSAIDNSAGKLRLFLDHNIVDETRMAVHALSPLTDPEHLFSDIEALCVLLDHLRDAEVFHLHSVL